MNSSLKGLLTFVAIVLMVLGVSFGLALFLSSSDKNQNTEQEQAVVTEPKIYTVPLDAKDIKPVNAEIKKFDYIQFNSEDGGQHQIVKVNQGEHGGEALKSSVFGGDEGYRVQFKDVGTFYLKDTFNPEQKITILVQE